MDREGPKDASQPTLDARLADLAGSLTPEQAERVKQRVQERMSSSNLDLSAVELSGALDLLFALPRGVARLPDLLDGVGRGIGDAVSVVNPFGGGGAGADTAGAILGQLGNLVGGVGGVGSDAMTTAGQALGQAGEVAGAAGQAGGFILEAIGDVLGGLN